jgi:hypothetical protein
MNAATGRKSVESHFSTIRASHILYLEDPKRFWDKPLPFDFAHLRFV